MVATIQLDDITTVTSDANALCVHRRADRDVHLVMQPPARVRLVAHILERVL